MSKIPKRRLDTLETSVTALEAKDATVDLSTLSATAAELNAVADESGRIVNTTAATLSLTAALHGDRIVTVNKADGAALTLPAATGSGNRYTIIIGTTITSVGTTIKAASASDSFLGQATGVDDDADAAYAWKAETDDDTVTLDGSSTGGKAGDKFVFTDYATGVFHVEGLIAQSGGSEATPFSATVS